MNQAYLLLLYVTSDLSLLVSMVRSLKCCQQRCSALMDIRTTFFSKLYHYFLQKTTFFSKLNSALFDRSHCSRRRSETMCLWRRDWMFAPTIRYQFKRHLFTRRPCTGPHLWAGPEGDCNCWDTGIEISFNFSRSRQFAFVRNACGH
jgi:hypothetical protein